MFSIFYKGIEAGMMHVRIAFDMLFTGGIALSI
jgi:hypothetical protein